MRPGLNRAFRSKLLPWILWRMTVFASCAPGAACARRFLDQLPLAYLASIADADGTVTLFSGYRFEVAAPAPGAAAERDATPPGTA